MSNNEIEIVSKIWSSGENMAIGIPRNQQYRFKNLKGKKLLIKVIEYKDSD